MMKLANMSASVLRSHQKETPEAAVGASPNKKDRIHKEVKTPCKREKQVSNKMKETNNQQNKTHNNYHGKHVAKKEQMKQKLTQLSQLTCFLKSTATQKKLKSRAADGCQSLTASSINKPGPFGFCESFFDPWPPTYPPTHLPYLPYLAT